MDHRVMMPGKSKETVKERFASRLTMRGGGNK
jgi:hypothetical protein